MQSPGGIDWQGLGYLISIVSVFFPGAIARPKLDGPWWHLPTQVVGMAMSIIGMGCRSTAHLDQQPELKRTEVEARRR